jgi:hypothetical protein
MPESPGPGVGWRTKFTGGWDVLGWAYLALCEHERELAELRAGALLFRPPST